MATFDRVQTPITPAPQKRGPMVNRSVATRLQTAGATVLTYVMRGQDANVDGQYDTWKSVGAADLAAANYHGDLATPLRDVAVQSKG